MKTYYRYNYITPDEFLGAIAHYKEQHGILPPSIAVHPTRIPATEIQLNKSEIDIPVTGNMGMLTFDLLLEAEVKI